MDIPNSSGFACSTYYGNTKYDLGGNSCGKSEASTPGSCYFFFSGHCRAGNRCSHSHNYQTLDSFYNYKHDDRTERTDCRIYIVPAREGSRWTGTVLGPEISAASSSQYNTVNDSMDLIVSITRDHEAGVALTSELPPTGDLVDVALHGTDRRDVEWMAVNVRSHQSSEKEQLADCKEEKHNILKAGEIAEIAAASSSQYAPVNDSMDLIVSITRDREAGVALTSELPPTGDLVGVALHGTDRMDVERMAVNARSHQSSEKEQLADCKEEKQNILKAEEIAAEIAAASSSQYDPVNDSMDLIVSIIRDHEAGVALTSELPPTGDLVGVALHGTDPMDVDRIAVNVRSHQSREKEQLAVCKEETQNILKAEEIAAEIAAASSSQYAPVNDSMDLIVSITRDREAGVALTSELPPTGDLVGFALHGTDRRDVERMAVNVRSHQSSEKEQLADCKEEKQNILKAEEIAERKDRTEVANKVRDVMADERKEMTGGKSLRAFKFALTEFVKELLIPTWNERKIDREAYKTIVEKVVNKVIFSVQSIHIPRTQENINNYLAASKPNISKLLQAYIRREKAKAKAKASVA